MNFKFNSLYDKIRTDFIKGVYGYAKIPTKSEIVKEMLSKDPFEYVPITKSTPLKNINVGEISGKISDIVDDIGVVFDAVEDESQEILDQLTASLKEHNGVKRELKNLKGSIRDIQAGKIGEDYLTYSFTESFDTVENINSLLSDPIDTKNGVFSIRADNSRVLTLSHYYGKKLEFNITESFTDINEATYVGETDAVTILNQEDPRHLIYRIKTRRSTRLKVSTSIQLRPDATPENINRVVIGLNSKINKGAIRLYYRQDYQWKDVRVNNIHEVKGDKVSFEFPPEDATHIKIEFIKYAPDVADLNEYYILINNLAISRSSSKGRATLISKPISMDSYSRELPVINSIFASGDLIVPDGCDVRLYVSRDTKISGSFKDSAGNEVDESSVAISSFDPSGTSYVFLSSMQNLDDDISGISLYRGLDFDWKELRINNKSSLPERIEFGDLYIKEGVNNSVFDRVSSLDFEDVNSTGVTTFSGWCNSSNPQWAGTLKAYVSDGSIVSGIDVATDLSIAEANIEDADGTLNPLILADTRYSGQWLGYGSGYQFNCNDSDLGRVIRFGDSDEVIDGWWRPDVEVVTPTGLLPVYSVYSSTYARYILNTFNDEVVPEFSFNGFNYYKIFRFSNTGTFIDNSIKLYTYEERPVVNEDYYPHQFTWKYRSSYEEITQQVQDQQVTGATTFSGYSLPLVDLETNEEFIVDAISDVKIHGTNSVLDSTEYNLLKDDDNVPSGISFTCLSTSRPSISPADGISFDYNATYWVRNRYRSTWTGFAIIDSGATNPNIKILNSTIYSGSVNTTDRVIKKIVVEDLDNNSILNEQDELSEYRITFPTGDTPRHFKITLYCASDETTGFCAKGAVGNPWVPHQRYDGNGTIISTSHVKIVSSLSPMALVSLGSLLYDTELGITKRCAIFEDSDGDKYLIVREPVKFTFPGYYYDSINKKYVTTTNTSLGNKGHYVRQGHLVEDGNKIYYTTGSSGSYVSSSPGVLDRTWNDGVTLTNYPNTSGGINYPVHSTYGISIDLENEYSTPYPSNCGNLYHGTAENLPAYYSLYYKRTDTTDDTKTRFLYKLDLESKDPGALVPVVKSVTFTLNK